MDSMQSLQLKHDLSPWVYQHIEICKIPSRRCGELWSWETSQRVEEQAINDCTEAA